MEDRPTGRLPGNRFMDTPAARSLAVVAVATGAALTVWAAAPLLGAPPAVSFGPGPVQAVTPAAVAAAAASAGVLGWGLLAVLGRTPRGRRLWTAIAAAAAALSLAAPPDCRDDDRRQGGTGCDAPGVRRCPSRRTAADHAGPPAQPDTIHDTIGSDHEVNRTPTGSPVDSP